jgi:hypothetical protein
MLQTDESIKENVINLTIQKSSCLTLNIELYET